MSGACAVWDLTISEKYQAKEHVEQVFKVIAKKWAFQLEEGDETGYRHFQCRISLYGKKTFQSCKAILDAKELEGYRLSPTSKTACKGAPFYVMKEDTRLEGPWTDKDDPPRPVFRTVAKMDANGLLPWQNEILLQTDDWDDRHIHVVIDKRGNCGKTALLEWAYTKKLATIVPPMTTSEDLVAFVMSMPKSSLYLIDMPRAQKKKHLYGLYSGIETIKNGILYDKRYHGKFEIIERPNLVVFTNQPPKLRYLSRDRWKLWTVVDQRLEVFKWDVVLRQGQLHAQGAGSVPVAQA